MAHASCRPKQGWPSSHQAHHCPMASCNFSDGSSFCGSKCNTTRDAQSHGLSDDELAAALTVCAARRSRCIQPNQKPGMCVGGACARSSCTATWVPNELLLLRQADVCSNASQIRLLRFDSAMHVAMSRGVVLHLQPHGTHFQFARMETQRFNIRIDPRVTHFTVTCITTNPKQRRGAPPTQSMMQRSSCAQTVHVTERKRSDSHGAMGCKLVAVLPASLGLGLCAAWTLVRAAFQRL
jgi:hypothetical protein